MNKCEQVNVRRLIHYPSFRLVDPTTSMATHQTEVVRCLRFVPSALRTLDKGGTLVLGGIHLSTIPEIEYDLLYRERVARSDANILEDGRAFLTEAAMIPIKTSVQTFRLEEASDALIALKNDAIKGAGVLVIA